jgi:CheY-like chemotaxis protein/signal transduction histidine kinase/HAMP domain-containing protein
MKALIFQQGLGRTLLAWFLGLALIPVIIVSIISFGVIAEIGKGEAFASTDSLFRIVIVLLIVTGIVVVFGAIYIAGRIVRPIQVLSSSAKRVAAGELGHEINVNVKNELGELADGLNYMVRNLRTTIEENKLKNQLKEGQANLNIRMRGELEIGSLGKNIITFLCEFLNAKVGAIYMANESGTLKLVGSYAYVRQKNIPKTFKPGEGLIGQAALGKKHILVTRCPEDYISIHSGMGKAVPRNILVYPLRFAGDVKGVVELGAFHDFSGQSIAFMDQVQESIAIALNSVLSRNRTAMLLKQTQKQAEELQVQQEELRQANEELEEHASALETSEAKLQAQQEELRQTNEELEEQAQRLEEQKVDIEKKNKELEEARQLLEEKARDLELSSKYKSEFLANMSHELRTPLNSILLLARHMADNRDGSLTLSQVESAQSIYSSGAELLTLINEVLDLSKVESGKMELHVENVALEDISNSMKRHFSPFAQEKGLKWDVEIAGNMPEFFRTDRLRAEQVLKNFLSNAFKFTESGRVTLRIYRPGSRADEATFLMRSGMIPAKTVAFAVTDTGSGIPEGKQKLIFDAFQQADGTTNRKYGGTGLGLSISKELSKLLGGEIRMTSSPGKGSTFTLYLPEPRVTLSKTDDLEEMETLKTVGGLIKPPLVGKRKPVPQKDVMETIEDDRKHIAPEDKSVLIIEDDPAYVKILRNLAREHGFKCLVAGDGETGLHFADFYKPGAIILDIGLPRLNGWAVMTRLKENPRTRHIPVHFISASDRHMDALRMGAVDFLTKPGSPEMLDEVYEKLDQVISKQVKDLLVVEDNAQQAKAIAELVGNGDVRVSIASTADQAFKKLLTGKFDCMILDLGLPDMSGVSLLNKTRNNDAICHIPIIIYTGRELSAEERKIIDEYAESTIIKGADSHQRLLDETALFLHRVEADLPEEQQKMLRMLHDKEAILANKKVLIVDDDMRNVFSLKKVLGEKDIHVLVGKNGKEGLEVLEKNPDTDLVLMDIMMPEMNGYEAMKAIRKQDRFKDLPIIALTAKAMKGDRSKCIDAGAGDYLAKPVDTDRLFSMLRVWLY